MITIRDDGKFNIKVFGDEPLVGDFFTVAKDYTADVDSSVNFMKDRETLQGYSKAFPLASWEQALVELWPTVPKTDPEPYEESDGNSYVDMIDDLSLVVKYFRDGDFSYYETAIKENYSDTFHTATEIIKMWLGDLELVCSSSFSPVIEDDSYEREILAAQEEAAAFFAEQKVRYTGEPSEEDLDLIGYHGEDELPGHDTSSLSFEYEEAQ